jgi:hypothetical protein
MENWQNSEWFEAWLKLARKQNEEDGPTRAGGTDN